jgi:hypothetical protein
MADKNKNENSVGNGIGPADEPRADIDNLLAEAAGSLDEIDSQLGKTDSDSAPKSPQPSSIDIASMADSKKSGKGPTLKTEVQEIDNTLANLEKELKNLTRQIDDSDDTADKTTKQNTAEDDALAAAVNELDSDDQNTSVADSEENQNASDDDSVDDMLAQLEQEMTAEENATDDSTPVANDSTGEDNSDDGDDISKVIAELPGMDVESEAVPVNEPLADPQDDSTQQPPASQDDNDEVKDQDDKVVMDELDLSIRSPRSETPLDKPQTEEPAQNSDPYADFNIPQKALICAVTTANKPFGFVSDGSAKDALGLAGIITIIISMVVTALILLLK